MLGLVEIDSKEVSKVMQFPTARREMLDKLQLRVIVYCDRIDVNALFPIKPFSSQKCTSSLREGDKGGEVDTH